MPLFGLLTGTQERSFGGLPRLPLVNLFAERAITEPTQFMLRSRPRLREFASVVVADVPTYALYFLQRPEGDNLIVVYGENIYIDGVFKGDLTVSGAVSIAGNEMGAVITGGDEAKFWDGTDLRDVVMPDTLPVMKVLEQGGRFIFIPVDRQKYYWTEPLENMIDGSGDILIDALDFASAENESDDIIDAIVYRDQLVFGGDRTIETHSPTGNDDLPWASTIGGTINKGVLQTGAMALWDDSFTWVSSDWVVYRSNGVGGDIISNDGITEILPSYVSIILDSFQFQGHQFLRARPDETNDPVDLPHLLLDNQTGEWCEWSTGSGAFLGGAMEQNSTNPDLLFGSTEDGQLLTFGESYTAIEDPPTYSFRFGMPMDGGEVTIHNALLRCQTDLDGATISLRTSNDKGDSWVTHPNKTLDAPRRKVEWRSLGMFDQPGFLAECTVTNAATFSVSGASFNEFVGGRAR